MKQMNCTSLCIFSENWVLTKGCLLYETHSCLVGPWPPNKKLYKENRNQSLSYYWINLQIYSKMKESKRTGKINWYQMTIVNILLL